MAPRKKSLPRPPRKPKEQEEPEGDTYLYDPEEVAELFGTDPDDELLLELQGTTLAMARGETDRSTAQFNALKLLMEQRCGRPFTNDSPTGEAQVQEVLVTFTDATEDAAQEAADEDADQPEETE